MSNFYEGQKVVCVSDNFPVKSTTDITVDFEDFFAMDESDPVNKMLLRLPIVFDWVEFKGETVFMGINYDVSKKAKKPMIDIFHCATRALNDMVLFTTQWDKSKFKPSRLGQQF